MVRSPAGKITCVSVPKRSGWLFMQEKKSQIFNLSGSWWMRMKWRKNKKINEVKKKTKLWWCVSQVCLMVLMMRWVVTKVRKGLFVRHYHKQRITLLQENNNNKKRVFFVHLLNHKFFVHLNLLFFRISVCFIYGFVYTSP